MLIHSSPSGSANEDHVRSVGADGYVKFVAEDLANTIRSVLPADLLLNVRAVVPGQQPRCEARQTHFAMNLPLSLFLGWQHYLLGGVLIGTGVALLFVLVGLVGGMSTVFSPPGLFVVPRPSSNRRGSPGSRNWRLGTPLGLVLGAGWWVLGPGLRNRPACRSGNCWWAGFLVGYGALAGQCCTSGHGICGLGSMQWPSLLAVLTFMGGLSHGEPGGTVVAMTGERMSLPRFLAVLLAVTVWLWPGALSPWCGLRWCWVLRFEDFGLMLVMGGAVVVTLLAYTLAPRLLSRPCWAEVSGTHPSTWNRDTALGAALFGVGWGLCGVCPGPAIAGLGTGNWTLLWALWHRAGRLCWDWDCGRLRVTNDRKWQRPLTFRRRCRAKRLWYGPLSCCTAAAAHPLPPMRHCGVPGLSANLPGQPGPSTHRPGPAPGLRCAGPSAPGLPGRVPSARTGWQRAAPPAAGTAP